VVDESVSDVVVGFGFLAPTGAGVRGCEHGSVRPVCSQFVTRFAGISA
jgi:hypothetical protein